MKSILTGVAETLNPKGGQGLVESIVVLIIVLAVIYMNITGVEVMPIVKESFVAIMFFLFGRNSKKGKEND